MNYKLERLILNKNICDLGGIKLTRIEEKERILEDYLKNLNSVVVAFSSGVDSTFLLKKAKQVLGDNVIAVTAKSCSFPKRELNEAIEFCKKENIKHIIVESEELNIEGFSDNPKNRCYLCKKELFENPFMRWWLNWLGTFSVDREHLGVSTIKTVLTIKKTDWVLGIFPQGTRQEPGTISELEIKSPLRYARTLQTRNKRTFKKNRTFNLG